VPSSRGNEKKSGARQKTRDAQKKTGRESWGGEVQKRAIMGVNKRENLKKEWAVGDEKTGGAKKIAPPLGGERISCFFNGKANSVK